MTAPPVICLNMIVKNEAHIVHQVPDVGTPYLSSSVILDTGSTGSTDGTQDAIKNVLPPLSRRLPNQR